MTNPIQLPFFDPDPAGDYLDRIRDLEADLARVTAERDALLADRAAYEKRIEKYRILDERSWAKLHRDHPEVWRAIIERCDHLVRANRGHYGMPAIYEAIRFHTGIPHTLRADKSRTDAVALRNAHRAIFSRMIAELFPAYGRLFDRSESKFDGKKLWEDVWAVQPDREAWDRSPLTLPLYKVPEASK